LNNGEINDGIADAYWAVSDVISAQAHDCTDQTYVPLSDCPFPSSLCCSAND